MDVKHQHQYIPDLINITNQEVLDDDTDDIFEEQLVKPLKKEVECTLRLQNDQFQCKHSDSKNKNKPQNIKSEIATEVDIKTEEIHIKDEAEGGSTRMQPCQRGRKKTQSRKKIKKNRRKTMKIKRKPKSHRSNKQNSVDIYKCDDCTYQTVEKYRLNRHQVRHKDVTEVEMYHCSDCSFSSKYKRSLKVHSLQHTNPEKLRMHQEYLHKYRKGKDNVLVYSCDKCDYQTANITILQRHRILIHNQEDLEYLKTLQCSECSYKTFDQNYLRNHIRRHKKDLVDNFRCPHCSYRTVDRSNFNRHVGTHFQNTTYTCFDCGLQTKNKNCLKYHVMRHTNSTDVKNRRSIFHELSIQKCQYCEFKTKTRADLLIHEGAHKNAKKIKVHECQKCEYKTIYKSSMKRHIDRHENHLRPRPELQKCDKCDFETTSRFSLRHHSLMHKNGGEAELYKCNKCTFETIYGGNFKRHVQRHKGEQVYYHCYECNFKRVRKDELRNHIFRHHKKDAFLSIESAI